jgi:hypothetical protein
MEDKGFGDAVFGEGVLMTLWSGYFLRPNPSTPRVLPPFSFEEMEPLSSSQCERSLLLSMVLTAKGDLSKSLNEIKASSKVETTVPMDYHGFIYLMKAYSAIIGIITGKNSFVSVQLENLVRSIEKYAACYKLEIAQDKCSPGKFKNVVDSRFHLFLQECSKSLDREDINNCLVNFRDLHKGVLLHKFNVQSLPAFFSLEDKSKKPAGVETTTSNTNNPNGNNPKNEGSKCKSGNEGNKSKGGKKRPHPVEHKDQVPEFKMTENETWDKFQGKCVES